MGCLANPLLLVCRSMLITIADGVLRCFPTRKENMRDYVSYSLERAVKTVAQTLVAVILASEVITVVDVDWVGIAGVAALSGILSLLTSVANYKKGSASGT